ncbi:class I SAM-dependent methyltransferase [Povalibacter sp.]|uniref:class I SAM-dependent methyltransferase n=1 Tax=Povalibacter sp. TaxID=1962978 RepID=UPI002F4006B1
MFNRRTLLGVSAATVAAASLLPGAKVYARGKAGSFPGDIEPRGTVGRVERLPRLDLESQQDFLTGLRGWVNKDLVKVCRDRTTRILEKNGLDPKADISLERALELLKDDPILGTRWRAWISLQQATWRQLLDEFHGNYDRYMSEMEAADKAGPGTLELNPGMKLPDYTRHEIHLQPGGYVGDPFAGHVYHYGTNNFFADRNNQDELHIEQARAIPPPPADGKVRRILDMGCSCGQMTVALKERFPDAEVWGIDVGGPMVRYAHMRAVDLGVDVNFAQRLAEDTKFPDGHFDIVTSFILHHEVSTEASKQIIREAHRVLRRGGVFYPIDFFTHGELSHPKRAFELAHWWWAHRWNHEVLYYDYANVDYLGEMSKAGFIVDQNGPPSRSDYKVNLMGVKPV